MCRRQAAYDVDLCLRQNFTGIENVMRIERLLERPHGLHRLRPKFLDEVFLLALTDAVFAGAGSIHCLSPLDQPMQKTFSALHLVGIVDVTQ